MIHENWRWQPWYRAIKQLIDGGAIGQNLGDPVGDFVGVVAHADNRIGAAVRGMFAHVIESFLTRRLGEVDVDRKLAAEDRLHRAGEIPQHAARAHGNAAHKPEVPDDAITYNVIRGGDDHSESPLAAR